MTKVTIEAHCADDEFEADILKEFNVTITDRSNEPWAVVFEGTRENLTAMVKKHWGYPDEEIPSDWFAD